MPLRPLLHLLGLEKSARYIRTLSNNEFDADRPLAAGFAPMLIRCLRALAADGPPQRLEVIIDSEPIHLLTLGATLKKLGECLNDRIQEANFD